MVIHYSNFLLSDSRSIRNIRYNKILIFYNIFLSFNHIDLSKILLSIKGCIMGYLTIQEQNFYIDSVQEMPWVILLELAMNGQV